MAEWSTSKAALEVRGAHHVRVLEITLTDPDGYGPNSGWYTTTKTLRLVDNTQQQRTSSGTVDNEYWPGVLEWGDVYQGQDFGSAFTTVSDAQYVLANIKISPLKPGSEVNAGTGPTPEPIGDEIKLSDLMRYYEWTGAVVTDKIISYEDTSLNQVSADYKSTTIFTGIATNATVNGDRITLDVIESEKERLSPVGQTYADDPQDRASRGEMIPVLFGQFAHEDYDGSWASDSYRKTWAGGRPSLVKLVQWRRGDAAVTNELDTDTRYAWMDVSGVNSGWLTQPDWTTADDSPDVLNCQIFRYIPDVDGYTWIDKDAAMGVGKTQFVDNPSGVSPAVNDVLYIRNRQYFTGYAFIPCDALQEENTAAAISNEQNMFNRDWTNYAELAVDVLNHQITCRIPDIQSQGSVVIEADAVSAWMLISVPSTFSNATLSLTIWKGTISGGAAANGHTAGTTTLGASTLDTTLFLQTAMTSGTHTTAYLYDTTNFVNRFPANWQWYESDSGKTQQYVSLKVTSASATAGAKVRIYAMGVRVKHYIARSVNPFALTSRGPRTMK